MGLWLVEANYMYIKRTNVRTVNHDDKNQVLRTDFTDNNNFVN